MKLMEAQGYILEENIIFQENRISMLMKKNGKQSCGKETMHIDRWYFFIKDRIEKKKLIIEYCPIDEIIGYIFSKTLKGSLFNNFRNIIMKIEEWSQPKNMQDYRSVLGEITTI